MSKELVHINVSRNPLIVGRTIFRSVNDFCLNDRDKVIARKELFETEEKKKECLAELTRKLSEENIIYRLDEDYLLRYLRCRKYKCDTAFKNIKNLYSNRKKYPHLFDFPANIESHLNEGFLTLLPYADEDGCVMYIAKIRLMDTRSLDELLPSYFAVADIVLANPHCQINGVIAIWDFKGMPLRKMPEIMRFSFFLAEMLQDCYPSRVKQFILFNCAYWHIKLYRSIRFLIKKKIDERVKLLGTDYSELHKLIDPRILPKEYGGLLEEQVDLLQHAFDNFLYLKYERSFGSTKNN